MAFRHVDDVGSHNKPISGLYLAAHSLTVYASHVRLPAHAQHSLPAGGQPWPDGLLTRRVTKKDFHQFMISLLPRLCLAHQR